MKNHSTLKASLLMLTAAFLLSCNSGQKQNTDNTDQVEDPAPTITETADFQISLAQWSLHKTFFGGPIEDWEEFGQIISESPDDVLKGVDPMEFPSMAAAYGIYSIELVNTFYFSKAEDGDYWVEFKKRCDDAGVSVGLIMCDQLGDLGHADAESRNATVKAHYKWVDIAEFLGAKSVRVNAAGLGTPEEVASNAADGLRKLGEYGASKGINIIVENHGGISSNGEWLSGVMEKVGMDNVGTLPDFGNFCIQHGPEGCVEEYDRYKGIAELMPFAKGVSAKSQDFDEEGNETQSDFLRIMKIVKDSGFKGYVGIEYEGALLSEDEGIKATKALLEKVFAEL